MKIGDWVRRTPGPGNRDAKWHHVESVVAGDAVTKCGRRMRDERNGNGGLEVSDSVPLTRMIGQPQLCQRCS